jgi:acyl-coenzyme A synthetase/AMP-(fatty) acid ligase
MPSSIIEKVKTNAKIQGQKTAVIAEDLILTYQELWDRIIAFSCCLRTKGVGKGDCVLIQTSHTAAFIIAVFAVHLSGAIFVPVDKAASAEYITHLLHATDARAFIAQQQVPAAGCMLIQYHEVLSAEDPSFPADAMLPSGEQSADLIFTTGTTGEAKGVEVSHGALVAGIENITVGYWIEDDIRYLVYGPLNHTFTIRRLYALLFTGNTVVLLEGLINIKKFFELIDRHQINATHMNPSAVRMLFSLTKDTLADYAHQFKFIETGTAPFPEADKERLHALLPKTRLSFGYGCSESDAVAKYNYSDYMGRSGCVGKPTVHSVIYIIDENGAAIESSREHYGLVACRGPMNMKGYWREPGLTAEVMRDGIVYTNDIGYFDEEGFLYILGRANEVINVGGIKVAAKEIEDRALMIPGVVECACIGVTDALSAQAPKLFVVMDDAYDFSAIAITEQLAKTLETYKLPKYIEKVRELPKTYNGKIQKNLLK